VSYSPRLRIIVIIIVIIIILVIIIGIVTTTLSLSPFQTESSRTHPRELVSLIPLWLHQHFVPRMRREAFSVLITCGEADPR
jgi:heme/copper-type cytochrome/quinol oxidase subunit 2